jgi:ubiquitin fusion degradation protein 1
MLEDLCINEGDTINVELVLPVTGSFIKIRPHETAFIDLPDPKAVLELCFSTDYQVLANSSTITVFDKQSEKSYLVDIVETQPSDYIKMIDTDIEVDFDKPLDYIEPIPSPEPSPPPSPVNTFNQSTGFVPFSGKGYKLGSK